MVIIILQKALWNKAAKSTLKFLLVLIAFLPVYAWADTSVLTVGEVGNICQSKTQINQAICSQLFRDYVMMGGYGLSSMVQGYHKNTTTLVKAAEKLKWTEKADAMPWLLLIEKLDVDATAYVLAKPKELPLPSCIFLSGVKKTSEQSVNAADALNVSIQTMTSLFLTWASSHHNEWQDAFGKTLMQGEFLQGAYPECSSMTPEQRRAYLEKLRRQLFDVKESGDQVDALAKKYDIGT